MDDPGYLFARAQAEQRYRESVARVIKPRYRWDWQRQCWWGTGEKAGVAYSYDRGHPFNGFCEVVPHWRSWHGTRMQKRRSNPPTGQGRPISSV